MTDRLVARAPGKLFLLGEYAVLDGCAAIVAAVDRGVTVTLRTTSSPQTSIRAAQMGAVATFPGAQPPPPQGPLRFALSALRTVTARLPQLKRGGLDITITSDLTLANGTKAGFGSSAAVTVALTAAVLAALGRDRTKPEFRDEVFALAHQAHGHAQDGIGSGADVAASAYGGIVRFEPGRAGPTVRRLTLPAAITVLAGWTGEAASTSRLVMQYLAARSEVDSSAHRAFLQATRTCVERFTDGHADLGTLCDAIDGNGRALERMAEELNLPLMTPQLTNLVRIARSHGAAAKASGAGGGDCGIAAVSTPSTAASVRAAWVSAGILPVDLRVHDQGVSVDYR